LRRKINGVPLPRKILWTANPKVCWLKDQFVDKKMPGKAFLPALPYDNPHLPEWYIPKMEEDMENMPELLKAYRDGSWDVLAGADQLIKEIWITQAKDIHLNIPNKHVIGVDPARYGDDELVLYGLENSKIIDSHFAGMSDSNYIINEIEQMAFRMFRQGKPPSVIGCDITGGWGSGVEDNLPPRMKLWRFPCKFMGYSMSERQASGVPEGIYNRRAEIWMEVQKMFSSKQIEMDFSEHPELRRQLMHLKYDIRVGGTYIQAKDEIKKALGRSPDRGDAYAIGLYVLRFAIPQKQDSLGLFAQRKKKKSWMAA